MLDESQGVQGIGHLLALEGRELLQDLWMHAMECGQRQSFFLFSWPTFSSSFQPRLVQTSPWPTATQGVRFDRRTGLTGAPKSVNHTRSPFLARA